MSKLLSDALSCIDFDEELNITIGINPNDDSYTALIMTDNSNTNQICYTVRTIEDVANAIKQYLSDDIK